MRKITLLLGMLFIVNANAQLGSGWDWASISTVATYSPGRQVIDIATDNSGNVYATGRFQGSMTIGGHTVATSGDGTVNFNFDEDAFVVKYNSSGEAQWLKKYGNNATGSNQVGQVIAVDDTGNVYIGGSGNATATTGSAFLVKYDTNGNLLWAKTDFPLFEIGGINFAPDGNLIVQESNGSGKNIYKINPANGAIVWTVINTGAGCNSTTTFQDFVDTAGNIYYTCFGTGAVNIAGQALTVSNVTTFIASIDTNGVTRWVQAMDNVQVQLGYTIDPSNGKSYIQISGGFGSSFQGISTGSGGGSRYFELDSNGIVTRNMFASPYKGLFRVKGDFIYGFTYEQWGFDYTLTYGSYNFTATTDNTKGFGIVIQYNKSDDAVTYATAFIISGGAWNSGKLRTIEVSPTGKIIVGGQEGTGVTFGDTTFSVLSSSGSFPTDLFISQGSLPSLATTDFSRETFAMFPNPASNILQFNNTDRCQIRIYNMIGQPVIQKTIEAGETIDISQLARGTYIVECLNSSNSISHAKLLKN